MYRLVLAALVFSLTAPALQAAELLVPLNEYFEGRHISFYIDAKELAKQPAWVPGEAKVPLSVEDTVANVRAWVKQNHPQAEGVEFEEIALKSLRRTDGKRLWHYLIRYDDIVNGHVIHDPIQFCVVLFDGTVLPAVIERHPLD